MKHHQPLTEESSHYRHLDTMPIHDLLVNINNEDSTIAGNIKKAIPEIEKLVNVIADKMLAGGRLFYVGAGTSGRLAVVDASECQPTFGVPPGLVIGLIAGGEKAFTQPVEFAEDDQNAGWHDLSIHFASKKDIVVGVTASGNTPYVLSALKACKENGMVTGCITCNDNSGVEVFTDHLVKVMVGPEFITGSTRMKCGSAQKMVLNMISTSVMIQLGRVEDNKMVNMQLSNAKLIDRGVKMVMESLSISYNEAMAILLKSGSVKAAIEMGK